MKKEIDPQEVLIKENQQLKGLLYGAYYSGERFIVREKEGALAAVVPIEDLEVLEQIEQGRFTTT